MESNGGMKDLSRHIYYYDEAKRRFERYRDMEKHLKEVEDRNLELKKQNETMIREVSALRKLVTHRLFSDHFNMAIENEPEFKRLCRAAGLNDIYGDPTLLDYDLRRELENSNREIGTTPF